MGEKESNSIMGRILACGDIHTKLWIIDTAEQIIEDYDAVVFVGDYADDWDAAPILSIETWKRLRQLQFDHPNKVHLVIGNHDYIYANYTKTTASGYNRTTQLLLDVPENVSLKIWLKTLPVIKKIDGVTYSHAGLSVSWVDGHDLWDDNSPLWTRPGDEEYQNMSQVFGHTPSETCWEVQPNVWCIDTFSTHPDGTPIGDGTVLEIIDGKEFKKFKLRA